MKQVMTILTLLLVISTQAQQANEAIIAGNQYYRTQQYEQAEQQYNTAIKLAPANNVAKFNLAGTVYRRGKNEDAIKSYEELAAYEKDAAIKSQSYYNKGAILSKEKKLEESIEAYKNALRQNPNDKQARENLQKALLELKKKDPPKKKEEDKKKQKQQQQQQKQQQQKQQPKMNQREAEQRLKLLEQKEKEVQQRMQKEKAKTGGSQTKDW